MLHMALVLGLAAPGCATAESRQAKPRPVMATVLSIGDGDTLRVRRNGSSLTVRLACIDAPELAQRPNGAQARAYLRKRLAIGTPVRLLVKSSDHNGRVVAEVIGAINLGLALVEDGEAFVSRRHVDQCDAAAYLAAEARARRRRRGVWQVPGGIDRPWQFRRSRDTKGS
ncbi:hypothetical protein CPCC7001_2277 [Cyanobium sp. PCC 7001]|nr:hypothetical protein CPCC7001_2277 [Cyanobium sp. PCC 7001]